MRLFGSESESLDNGSQLELGSALGRTSKHKKGREQEDHGDNVIAKCIP
jgi:hypothetical protein